MAIVLAVSLPLIPMMNSLPFSPHTMACPCSGPAIKANATGHLEVTCNECEASLTVTAHCSKQQNGKYLRNHLTVKTCPWDADTCLIAAQKGHLECLKYAHENGCPWDEQTCAYAAQNGHLDCLKYAHENGCPWNMRAPHQLHSERNDERRGGAPFVTFLTGAQIDPATGTNDGDVHVAYNLPSFDFDVCACALTPRCRLGLPAHVPADGGRRICV